MMDGRHSDFGEAGLVNLHYAIKYQILTVTSNLQHQSQPSIMYKGQGQRLRNCSHGEIVDEDPGARLGQALPHLIQN